MRKFGCGQSQEEPKNSTNANPFAGHVTEPNQALKTDCLSTVLICTNGTDADVESAKMPALLNAEGQGLPKNTENFSKTRSD